ncbi:hypothetical protein B0H16DRAFT_1612638 [Mycena metata]|uniref:Uncharacterized protein n=1 Tax=Mycena metata TaxID=1033252 RepID=A0AAD7HB91_9AGAR|nr:hypothetical protein B0H16DRAFT_1612638 [Mycena metata]
MARTHKVWCNGMGTEDAMRARAHILFYLYLPLYSPSPVALLAFRQNPPLAWETARFAPFWVGTRIHFGGQRTLTCPRVRVRRRVRLGRSLFEVRARRPHETTHRRGHNPRASFFCGIFSLHGVHCRLALATPVRAGGFVHVSPTHCGPFPISRFCGCLA